MSAVPFKFDFEIEAFEKSGAEAGTERRIGGIVSTDHMDKQQEIILQEGLDFGPFLKSGFFNDNHLDATGKAVGFPQMAELRKLPDGKKGWYVEGYLLKGHEPADEIWSFAQALKRSGGARKLGFSVEGSILDRDPENQKIVRKAVVREVAITRCPINDKTNLMVLAKSLSAGHGAPAGGTPGDGSPLRVESLEGAPPARPKAKKRKLKKSEAIEFLMRVRPETPRAHAEMIVDYAMRHYPAS